MSWKSQVRTLLGAFYVFCQTDLNTTKVHLLCSNMGTNNNKIKALAIVAGVSTMQENEQLKAELTEAKIALAAIETQGKCCEEKYCDLVWMARRNPDDVLSDPTHPSYDPLRKMMMKYPKEADDLDSKDGYWHHGFNSGVLAASRMFRHLAVWNEKQIGPTRPNTSLNQALAEERELAIEAFPSLDT